KCLSPDCPNFSCADSYCETASNSTLINRNDNFCLVHLRLLGSFEKAGWKDLASLEAYSSIHTSGLSYSSAHFAENACAILNAACSSAPAVVVGIATRCAYDSICSLIQANVPSWCGGSLRGIGVDRFSSSPDQFQLASKASAVAAFNAFKILPIFRERGFILEKSGSMDLPIVLTVDGFMHSVQDARSWRRIVQTAFPHNTWLSVQWDAACPSTEASVTDFFSNFTETFGGFSTSSSYIASTAYNSLSAFDAASQNADGVGLLVADALARLTKGKTAILIGHSLGASVVYHTLKYLARHFLDCPTKEERVEKAYLLGSACLARRKESRSDGWNLAASAVKSSIFNLHAPMDDVLTLLGNATGSKRAGANPIETAAVRRGVRALGLEAERVLRALSGLKRTVMSVDLTFLGTASAQPSPTRNHSSLALRCDGVSVSTTAHADEVEQIDHQFQTVSGVESTDEEVSNLFWNVVSSNPGGTGGFSRFTVMAAPIKHTVPSVGYYLCESSLPGKLRAELATPILLRNKLALGLKNPMVLLQKLKNGERLEMPDGSVLLPEDYMEPSRRGRRLLVVGDTSDALSSALVKLVDERGLKDAAELGTIANDFLVDLVIHEATNSCLKSDLQTGATEQAVEEQTVNHGHSTPRMAAEFAKRVRARKLVLNHFSSRYKGDGSAASLEVMEEVRQLAVAVFGSNVVCARDFMNIRV
ncbi:hypothetical protein HDU82_000791, partial [Entophlyctis luteolus]